MRIIKGGLVVIYLFLLVWIPTYVFVCVWEWNFKPWLLLWIVTGWGVVKCGIYYSNENKHSFYLMPLFNIMLAVVLASVVYIWNYIKFDGFTLFIGLYCLGGIISPLVYKRD